MNIVNYESVEHKLNTIKQLQKEYLSNSAIGGEILTTINTYILNIANDFADLGDEYVAIIDLLITYAEKLSMQSDFVSIEVFDMIIEQIEGKFKQIKSRDEAAFYSYYQKNGVSENIKDNYHLYLRYEKKVYIINVDCSDIVAQGYISSIKYSNVELLSWESFINDISSGEIEKYSGTHVAFLEKGYAYDVWKNFDMSMSLTINSSDMCICHRAYDIDGNALYDTGYFFWSNMPDIIFGKKLLEACIYNRANVYGCLSTMVFKGELLNKLMLYIDKQRLADDKDRLYFMLYALGTAKVHFVAKTYVMKTPDRFCLTASDREKIKFLGIIDEMQENSFLNLNPCWKFRYEAFSVSDVKKELTVFYTDSAEYFCAKPIADLAEQKGYKIRFTKDIHEKAEVGIYCQHVCYPENSKISVVMLHDMAQRHNIWPNMWMEEPWNGFTIGVLPGKPWGNRWSQCASFSYVRPQLGTYLFGYPKGDAVLSDEIKQKAAAIKSKLKYNFTVLYAPSWENDGKEDDFVRLLHMLPINLLIKQVPVPDDPVFQFVADNIAAMRKLHDGKYANVSYVEQDENILVALEVCDLVVSDESSVMTEATFFGKPSIAVTDWLIPDTIPSRYAIVPVEYVIKTKLENLYDVVVKLSQNLDEYESACRLGGDFFAGKGHASEDIISLLDSLLDGKPLTDDIMAKQLQPDYELIDMWN